MDYADCRSCPWLCVLIPEFCFLVLLIWLVVKDQRGADACGLEVDGDVHSIGNCYELNAATQPEILAVDRQDPFDLPGSTPCISINGES